MFGGSALDSRDPKSWLARAEAWLKRAQDEVIDAEREVELAKRAVKNHYHPQRNSLT